MAFVEFPVKRRDNLPDLVHEGSWNWHHELVGFEEECVQRMTSATQTQSIIKHPKHPTAVR